MPKRRIAALLAAFVAVSVAAQEVTDTSASTLPTGLVRYEMKPRKPAEEEGRSFGAWVLWGVLVLAAALLSSLAFAIIRSMKNG